MAADTKKQQTNMIVISGNEETLQNLLSIIQKSGICDELANTTRRVIVESSKSETGTSCKRRKADLTCEICGAKCSGYNYNVISCESCKAFFYRNGSQNVNDLKCLSGTNKCNINFKDRRRMCIRCRLEKCLLVGMKRHFLNEEKLNKQHQLEENRRSTNNRSPVITQTCSIDLSPKNNNQVNNKPTTALESRKESTIVQLQTTQLSSVPQTVATSSQDSFLSSDDYNRIDLVKLSYETAFRHTSTKLDILPLHLINDRRSALVYTTSIIYNSCMQLIKFIRNIPEFELLDGQDRFLLVKYNAFLVHAIYGCLYYDRNIDLLIDSQAQSEESAVAFRQLMCYCYGKQFDIELNQLFRCIKTITDDDPVILQLMMVIAAFAEGNSVGNVLAHESPALINGKQIFEIQSNYTSLLFRYMIKKYSNYYQAARQYFRLMQKIIHLQLVVQKPQQILQEQLVDASDEEVNPVLKSIFHFN